MRTYICRQTGTRDCLCLPALHLSKAAASVPTASHENFFTASKRSKKRGDMPVMYSRSGEQALAAGSIHPEPLLGTWLNTNIGTRGIASAILTHKDGQIVLRIVAAGDPEPADWGET